MNTMLLSLDRFAKTLNRDDMSWFYNEYSDVILREDFHKALAEPKTACSNICSRTDES